MSTAARNRIIGLIVAAVIFVLDQAMKGYVTGPLGLREDGQTLVLNGIFSLTRTSNYGVSLGFLTAESMEMRWLLVFLTAGIALVVLIWLLREKLRGDILPLGLVLGGALGNIRDRFNHGHVIDYADLHFGEFRPFLVFNLADAAITIGVVIILARSFLIREKRPQPAGDPAMEI